MTERHLFVYGTLRKALRHEMYAVLTRGAQFVGSASVRGALFDLGAYPGFVVDDVAADLVTGELYALHAPSVEDTLAILDAYEGCAPPDAQPHEYQRALIDVALADGSTQPAWTYVLNRPVAGMIRIPNGDYVAWRREGAPRDAV